MNQIRRERGEELASTVTGWATQDGKELAFVAVYEPYDDYRISGLTVCVLNVGCRKQKWIGYVLRSWRWENVRKHSEVVFHLQLNNSWYFRPCRLTKWVPSPAKMTRGVVEAAIDRSRKRMDVQTLDMVQFHWYEGRHWGSLRGVIDYLFWTALQLLTSPGSKFIRNLWIKIKLYAHWTMYIEELVCSRLKVIPMQVGLRQQGIFGCPLAHDWPQRRR